jgi:hypothetical protein
VTKSEEPQPIAPVTARIVPMPAGDKCRLESERAKALQFARESLNFMIEHYQIDAKLKRAKYLALVKEGFSSEEALMLCK